MTSNEPASVLSVTCPMCHTAAPVTRRAIDAGGGWWCVRCGQHWDAARLVAAAASVTWTVDRDPTADQT